MRSFNRINTFCLNIEQYFIVNICINFPSITDIESCEIILPYNGYTDNFQYSFKNFNVF